MKAIIWVFKFVLWLAVFVPITWAIAYYVPFSLHAGYSSTHAAIYKQPRITSADFRQWAGASRAALAEFARQERLRRGLLAIAYPGFRAELYQLDQLFHKINLDYTQVIQDMEDSFRNNALLRQGWEHTVLANPTQSSTSGPQVARDLLSTLSSLGASSEVMMRYVQIQERQQAIERLLVDLRKRLDLEKKMFFLPLKYALTTNEAR
jgi:hypothetical protein